MVTPNPKPPAPLTFPGALFLLFVHFAAYMAVLMLGGVLSEGETVGPAFLLAAAVVGPLTALYVGLLRHAPHERTTAALRLGSPAGWQWAVLALGVLAGVALAPVVIDAEARIVAMFPPEGADSDPGPSPLLFVFVFTIASPTVIELFFRGFVQARLARGLGTARAWAATLLLFLLAWPYPRAMPGALLIGAPLGMLMAWSGTTWVPLAAHVGHRVAFVLLLLASPPFMDEAGRIAPGLDAVCAAVAAVALLGAWRVSRGRAR